MSPSEEHPPFDPRFAENVVDFNHFLYVSILINGGLILFFYLNYYLLIPKILYKKSVLKYMLILLSCFIVYGAFTQFANNLFFSEKHFSLPLFAIFLPTVLTIAISLAMRVTSDRLREDRERKEREHENLKSELSFLRSQISPHFLFNIMNNLVSLNRKKSDLVEPTLIKLSQLMRYMLYDSDEKKVSLEREIEYLESYIDLQKMRFNQNFDIQFDKKSVNTEGGKNAMIEPMLLIPFIENAFKHGTGMIQNPMIHIQLFYENNTLIFNILNKFDPLNFETKDDDSGIGLKNVTRRLALLYDGNHTLKITPKNDIFKVHLIIEILNS